MIGSGFAFSGSVSVFWVDVLGFFSFLLGLLVFYGLLFCAVLGFCVALYWFSFLGCCIFWFLDCCIFCLLHIFWLLHYVISSWVLLHFLGSGLLHFWLLRIFWLLCTVISSCVLLHFLVAIFCHFFLHFLPAFCDLWWRELKSLILEFQTLAN